VAQHPFMSPKTTNNLSKATNIIKNQSSIKQQYEKHAGLTGAC